MLTANVHQVCTQLLLTRFSDNNDTTKIRPRFAAEAISIDAQISSENWCSQPAVVRRKRFRAVENCMRRYLLAILQSRYDKAEVCSTPTPITKSSALRADSRDIFIETISSADAAVPESRELLYVLCAKCYPISVSSLSIKY